MTLKDLKENGITVGNETVKGALYCIAGNNLGSHSTGEFTENFSRSQYFCRYCEITRSEFQSDPNPTEGGDSQDIKGIKGQTPETSSSSVGCALTRITLAFLPSLFTQKFIPTAFPAAAKALKDDLGWVDCFAIP
ncbi:hypothetical protein NFI96_003138 [Prochilodus magdalenae]|nr:hypothetical protein NFI96_003138 [Prochilodus magdalenae]